MAFYMAERKTLTFGRVSQGQNMEDAGDYAKLVAQRSEKKLTVPLKNIKNRRQEAQRTYVCTAGFKHLSHVVPS